MNTTSPRRRFNLWMFTVAAVAAVAGTSASVQSAAASRAVYEQIDRIFQTREYEAPRFGPACWLENGAAYAIVEPAKAPATGREIARYDSAPERAASWCPRLS